MSGRRLTSSSVLLFCVDLGGGEHGAGWGKRAGWLARRR